MLNGYCEELFVVNFIIFVIPRFMASLLAVNHLYLQERALFNNIEISLNFLL
jgi:hypothetical protein